MKKCLIFDVIMVIFFVVSVICIFTFIPKEELEGKHDTYTKQARVIDNNTLVTFDGNEWKYIDIGKKRNTVVTVTFKTNYTNSIYDDEIIEIK